MIKIVCKSIGAGANSLLYYQFGIGMSGNALAQDIVVGLVLVNIAQVDTQQASKGIPPLDGLYEG